ncbi:hypothetical protein PG996_009112 [Apiospora saccharicola]|uniref:Uncharacterized protein n=1 Tax=Apiospora saccharicola TaxID=335842 RepID=A0ABR1UKE0_9PEZI
MAQELPNSRDPRTSPYGQILIEKENGSMSVASLNSISASSTEDVIVNTGADHPQSMPGKESNTFDSSKPRTFMDKLGFMSVVTLSVGFTAILSAVAVLCFIWHQDPLHALGVDSEGCQRLPDEPPPAKSVRIRALLNRDNPIISALNSYATDINRTAFRLRHCEHRIAPY